MEIDVVAWTLDVGTHMDQVGPLPQPALVVAQTPELDTSLAGLSCAFAQSFLLIIADVLFSALATRGGGNQEIKTLDHIHYENASELFSIVDFFIISRMLDLLLFVESFHDLTTVVRGYTTTNHYGHRGEF
ncbi:hypothetical protein MA16_Dca002000 [Dendrobium catenatum]|uniref:Uncharacterized protein n=1 Tax=Dendrobium catenatum TaxID=906689 RepID=A0A2I0XE42_9ASPA|nr:hypothetical protein MA16_Dca002000 [Dendrobium catenatum]